MFTDTFSSTIPGKLSDAASEWRCDYKEIFGPVYGAESHQKSGGGGF